VAEDAGDAGFGFSGEFDLDGGPPLSALAVGGDDDAVGEVEGPAALPFAQFPLADPTEHGVGVRGGAPAGGVGGSAPDCHGFGFGAHQADGVAVTTVARVGS
jgi:hypothetical protein